MVTVRRTQAILVAAAIGAFAVMSAGAEPPVILPGQEELVKDMLGGGEPVAGCKLVGAAVQRTWISARFACVGTDGEVAITLAHVDETGPVVARTLRFALAAPAPARLPTGFAAAITERVREREQRFQWHVLESTTPDPARRLPDRTRRHRGAVLFAMLAIPLAGVWIRARRARGRAAAQP